MPKGYGTWCVCVCVCVCYESIRYKRHLYNWMDMSTDFTLKSEDFQLTGFLSGCRMVVCRMRCRMSSCRMSSGMVVILFIEVSGHRPREQRFKNGRQFYNHSKAHTTAILSHSTAHSTTNYTTILQLILLPFYSHCTAHTTAI